MSQEYTQEEIREMMGFSEQDMIDYELGNLVREEDILPELLVDSREEALELLRKLSR